MREIHGLVERVIHSAGEDGGRSILSASIMADGALIGVRKLFTAGAPLARGWFFQAHGDWERSRYRGSEERVFSARTLLATLPEEPEMARLFLGRLLNEELDLPPSQAGALLAAFAALGWRDLPRRLVEQEVDLPSDLDDRFGARLRDALTRKEGNGSVRLVRQAGVDPEAGRTILSRVGGSGLVFELPYRVVEFPGVGFGNAHRLARAAGRAHIMPEKVSALLFDALTRIEGRGDTHAPLDALLEMARKLSPEEAIKLPPARQLIELLDDRFLTVETEDGCVLGRSATLQAEASIAEKVAAMLRSPDGVELPEGVIASVLARDAFRRLDHVQQAAVVMAARERLSIVTGGPGTGKSTIMEAVVAAHEEAGWDVLLAAPTGKAAKRLSETTGRSAVTLHRLLEAIPSGTGGFSWRRNAATPLGRGGPVIVLADEVSMMDVELAAALFQAIPETGKLVLVGDHDQLPSVGPGAVLRDLLASGVVPATRLVNVYRQGKGSAIASGAAMLRSGRLPELPAGGRRDGDLWFIPATPEEVADRVVEVVAAERQASRDIVVLSPQMNGLGGVHEINGRLSDLLNPGAPLIARNLALGDRVILIKNDHDRGVMNGEMGVIEPGGDEGGFRVRFDGGETHDFDLDEGGMFLRANAITAHRSQGSQYHTVVLTLHGGQRAMLDREILYTAWTRARAKLVLVGEKSAFVAAVARRRGQQRRTLLAELCRRLAPPRAALATSQDTAEKEAVCDVANARESRPPTSPRPVFAAKGRSGPAWPRRSLFDRVVSKPSKVDVDDGGPIPSLDI